MPRIPSNYPRKETIETRNGRTCRVIWSLNPAKKFGSAREMIRMKDTGEVFVADWDWFEISQPVSEKDLKKPLSSFPLAPADKLLHAIFARPMQNLRWSPLRWQKVRVHVIA
jgi:hypothetical protein